MPGCHHLAGPGGIGRVSARCSGPGQGAVAGKARRLSRGLASLEQGSEVPAVVLTTLNPPRFRPNLRPPPPGYLGQEEQKSQRKTPAGGSRASALLCRDSQGSPENPTPTPAGAEQGPRDSSAQVVPLPTIDPPILGPRSVRPLARPVENVHPPQAQGATRVARLLGFGAPLRPFHARPAPSTLVPPPNPPGSPSCWCLSSFHL